MNEPSTPSQAADPPIPTSERKRRWRLHFSVQTLTLLVLLIGSAAALWVRWDPWILQATLHGHTGPLKFVSFSTDGDRVVSASEDGTIRVWDAWTGGELSSRKGHTARLQQFARTANGPIIAVSGDDEIKPPESPWENKLKHALQRVTSFDWTNSPVSEVVSFLTSHFKIPIAFDENMSQSEREVEVSFCLNGRPLEEIIRMVAYQAGLKVYFADEKVLISTPRLAEIFAESRIRVWNLESEQFLLEIRGCGGEIDDVTFSPNGEIVLLHNKDGRIRIWDLQEAKPYPEFTSVTHADSFNWPSFSENGEVLAVSSGSSVALWDVQLGKRIHRIDTENAHCPPILSSDGRSIVQSSSEKMFLWDVSSGMRLNEIGLPGRWGDIFEPVFSPDSNLVLMGTANRGASVYEAQSGQEVAKLDKLYDFQRAKFFPDSRRIVTTCSVYALIIRDARSGKTLSVLPKPEPPDDSIPANPFFSPPFPVETDIAKDGNRIVAESPGHDLRVWLRRRPEWTYGIAVYPETWLTLTFSVALVWSTRRDRREVPSPPQGPSA